MRKIIALSVTMALLMSIPLLFAGQSQQSNQTAKQTEQANTAKAVTIKGEVVEMSCYANMGAKGASHKQCAIACANNGHSLGLVEDNTGKVYMVVSPIDKNTRDTLLPYVADHVSVTGTVIEKGGTNFLNLQSIERMKS